MVLDENVQSKEECCLTRRLGSVRISRWHIRYDQHIVFVGARYNHVKMHKRYGSTYIPTGPVGHSPQLEQAQSARDPFRFPTGSDLRRPVIEQRGNLLFEGKELGRGGRCNCREVNDGFFARAAARFG